MEHYMLLRQDGFDINSSLPSELRRRPSYNMFYKGHANIFNRPLFCYSSASNLLNHGIDRSSKNISTTDYAM